MAKVTLSAPFGGADISIETGRLAKQAAGSVIVSMGETVVLVTCSGSKDARPIDFLPLSCEYVEKQYAAGRIPGNFFKRERQLGTGEILNCRLMDRPLRPLFDKNWRKEIQLIATVMSYDGIHDPAICGMVGASAAAHISDIPFDGPAGSCRVILKDGEYKINPTIEEMEGAKVNLIVAATGEAVTMVEGEGLEASEDEMIDGIIAGHEAIKPIIELQNELRSQVGKEKQPSIEKQIDVELYNRVLDLGIDDMADALAVREKLARYKAISEVSKAVIAQLLEAKPELEERKGEIKGYLGDIQRDIVRTQVCEDGIRIDGRKGNDIRAISCELGVLPRTHGSAVFTRGETQALATVTLGNKRDEQRIDDLYGNRFVPFMLHYNFPPYCVGEVKRLFTSRREIGHGNLAYRGVEGILPDGEDFSYTIRIVSEVLESNGSSSMATVCASSLALMQAGVPVVKDVAGIAMGLIQEDDKIAILSDILGDEDHLGDMDFKVVGTEDGINALQMDIKIKGLSRTILRNALSQAREGRIHILNEMRKSITAPAEDLSKYAPRILVTHVRPDKIGAVIGPGGKTIKGISEQTGATIDIDDTGKVIVSGPDVESAQRAKQIVESITEDAEVGKIYFGTVRKIMPFGAFVEILPGKDGLVHISQLADHRVEQVEDILAEGDELYVKCIEVSKDGKIALSRKAAIEEMGEGDD